MEASSTELPKTPIGRLSKKDLIAERPPPGCGRATHSCKLTRLPTGAESARMQLILVCGPWSSGTTVVAGLLERLGLRGLPPYFVTSDPRTSNSFESMDFRRLIGELVDENTLRMRVDWPVAQQRLLEFRKSLEQQADDGAAPLFLKYPPSALLIPEICQVFATRLVYVLRPMQAIEATRERRSWQVQFGAAGAQVLYPAMFQALVDYEFPTHLVRYTELLRDPAAHAGQLARFCGLPADADVIARAAAFVRVQSAP
jgi:hypothetical protein